MASFYVIRGERVPAIDMDDLTIGETRDLQRLSCINSVEQIAAAAQAGDANVMAAILVIALSHHKPGLSREVVEQTVADLKWSEFSFETEDETAAEAVAAPPTLPTLVASGLPDSESASA